MLPWRAELAGRIERAVIDSTLLRDNPLGDPHLRPLAIYLPPGYDQESQRRYPVIFAFPGYTGHVGMFFNRTMFRQSLPELVDAMFASGDVPPAIVVYADACTSARRQPKYLDSPALGRYHSYICDELVPWIDAHYRTIPDRDHRAITGKSSGRYAAMVTPMLRADVFGALATHARDALFDTSYRSALPDRFRKLRAEYGGSYKVFLDDFRVRIPATKTSDIELIEIYAYAAAFSSRRRRDRASPLRRDRRDRSRGLGPLAGLGPGSHGRQA